MFARQVRLARLIAAFIDAHQGFELLPLSGEYRSASSSAPGYASIGIIVLFRAKDERINANLAARINRDCRIMVSGTQWEGRPAVRIAVCTWRVEEGRDLEIVKEVLEGAFLD